MHKCSKPLSTIQGHAGFTTSTSHRISILILNQHYQKNLTISRSGLSIWSYLSTNCLIHTRTLPSDQDSARKRNFYSALCVYISIRPFETRNMAYLKMEEDTQELGLRQFQYNLKEKENSTSAPKLPELDQSPPLHTLSPQAHNPPFASSAQSSSKIFEGAFPA